MNKLVWLLVSSLGLGGAAGGGWYGISSLLSDSKDKKVIFNLIEKPDVSTGHHEEEIIEEEDEFLSGEYEILWSFVSLDGSTKICHRYVKKGDLEKEVSGKCEEWAKELTGSPNVNKIWLQVEKNSFEKALNYLNLKGEQKDRKIKVGEKWWSDSYECQSKNIEGKKEVQIDCQR